MRVAVGWQVAPQPPPSPHTAPDRERFGLFVGVAQDERGSDVEAETQLANQLSRVEWLSD